MTLSSVHITRDLTCCSGGTIDRMSELHPPSLQIAIPQTEHYSLRIGPARIQARFT